MNYFLDDYNVFRVLKMDLTKLQLCFDKWQEFDISLNPKKCMFLVYSGVTFGYVVSKAGKLFDLKKISAIVNLPPPKTLKDI